MALTYPRAEPALSVHIRPLFTRPVEVVEIIVSHVQERHDLLSLALTSQVFRHVIIPSFLEVIHIRCDLRRKDVWKYLSSKPYIAARTRILELINEDFEGNLGTGRALIPSFSEGFKRVKKREKYEKNVKFLVEAVMNMTCLRRFGWSDQLPIADAFVPLFNSLAQRTDINEFYCTLAQFAEDPSLMFRGKSIFGPLKPHSISPLAHFPNITTVCLAVYDIPFRGDGSDNLIIQDWLVQFKTLQHLYLASWEGTFDFVAIAQRARWPSLVELLLEGRFRLVQEHPNDIPAENDYYRHRNCFSAFLHDHPTLERLSIAIDDDHSKLFQPNILPRLCSLVLVGADYFSPALRNWLPADIVQCIQYLECTISEEFLPLLRAMTSLRVLYAVDIELQVSPLLAEAIPHIQQLHIPNEIWFQAQSATTLRAHQDTLMDNLFRLKDLVQLEGQFVVNGRILFESQDIIMRIMEHDRLMYLDSFTREQWELLLKQDTFSAGGDFQLPRVTVPSIQKSAGFYIKAPRATL